MDFWICVAIGVVIGYLIPVKNKTSDENKSQKLLTDNNDTNNGTDK